MLWPGKNAGKKLMLTSSEVVLKIRETSGIFHAEIENLIFKWHNKINPEGGSYDLETSFCQDSPAAWF
jgi:hypothetical protein